MLLEGQFLKVCFEAFFPYNPRWCVAVVARQKYKVVRRVGVSGEKLIRSKPEADYENNSIARKIAIGRITLAEKNLFRKTLEPLYIIYKDICKSPGNKRRH